MTHGGGAADAERRRLAEADDWSRGGRESLKPVREPGEPLS
jgi:hypothetical protein